MRVVSDFRKLNKILERAPFPTPRIKELLESLAGFQWVSAIDLNMGYYHIVLDPTAQELCTIVFPWGKYSYNRLPMGIACAPDIFQNEMSTLMEELEYVRVYLDDLLVISKGTYEDHLQKLKKVLTKLMEAGLKVNLPKSHLAQTETEYLGYHISRDGIKPQHKKIQGILNLQAPKTLKRLKSLLGMVQYYRDM